MPCKAMATPPSKCNEAMCCDTRHSVAEKYCIPIGKFILSYQNPNQSVRMPQIYYLTTSQSPGPKLPENIAVTPPNCLELVHGFFYWFRRIHHYQSLKHRTSFGPQKPYPTIQPLQHLPISSCLHSWLTCHPSTKSHTGSMYPLPCGPFHMILRSQQIRNLWHIYLSCQEVSEWSISLIFPFIYIS
jgi:hypothetical protein